jgi:DNA replication protein DnaC
LVRSFIQCVDVLKRKREELKNQAKQYFSEIMKRAKRSDEASTLIPVGPTFVPTTRFNVISRDVRMLDRTPLYEELRAFLVRNPGGKHPVLYIQGPQGVGKSHLLLKMVHELRTQPSNRVIYVADCREWVEFGRASSDNAFQYFQNAILEAFGASDDDLLARIANCQSENDLVSLIASHCKKNNLALYAVFDQHNGIPEDLRERFPYTLPHGFLPRNRDWRRAEAQVIISASANNYFLKTLPTGQRTLSPKASQKKKLSSIFVIANSSCLAPPPNSQTR